MKDAPKDFHRRSKALDGLQAQCRACDADRTREARVRTKTGGECKLCCGLPWRRARPVCPRCKLPFEPEPEVQATRFMRRF